MPSKMLRRSIGLATAGLVAATAIDAHAAVPDSARHARYAYASRASAGHGYVGRAYAHRSYVARAHSPSLVRGAPLPYGPEYGFLRKVPANAIVGPGYTFVPGVGILGESCDLPTSACPNEYRDVR